MYVDVEGNLFMASSDFRSSRPVRHSLKFYSLEFIDYHSLICAHFNADSCPFLDALLICAFCYSILIIFRSVMMYI
jgi:hypothetical protein